MTHADRPTPRLAPTRYRHRRRARRAPALVLVALLAVAAVAAATGLVASLTAAGAGSAGAASGAAERSTPRSEWRRGVVPKLYQTDPEWAGDEYAGATIRESGCGPTCLAMAYVALTGRTDRGPAEMAAFSERGGHVSDGMTAWTLMTDGAAELGLTSEELPADAGRVRSALAAGQVVICSMRPGDFTTTGHFIVLAGVTDDGDVIVRDPNSAERTARAWDLEDVLGQCANLWALSA
ncbi:C39 family peptidase [Thermophilibacter sp.]